ncbi:iron-only hydrogenase system regulator [Clostridium botulinum C]|uniref:Iron-only hydrogenase system regulator n=3 Tax=Clostridium botulinum TaxID=1491 RepID=A0A9Q4TS58_CLOBO|nr:MULTISPECIES: TM1266 family iron-only hydrogenase system putative regulator [Clostridium]AYF53456.1 iron-only hydrogenase system regulator [Clostridium novyi]EES90898.1 conserved hypothetical protein [Clostridium botulinum D str. 1873]KEI06728.1 iron-only hydrogenase system regulator [Clostridium sp. K25]MBO3441731.1 iron-only hydrogenase system regulator [Clostridium haemolyticum]MCD3193685.1 iron-only hydrogenase system regulator [Clostridium botulinum C]
MKKIAVISAILENPKEAQKEFNEIISNFKGIIKGRMGIPFEEEGISVICITVVAELNDINSLTGKLGNMKNVLVKTSIAKKEI